MTKYAIGFIVIILAILYFIAVDVCMVMQTRPKPVVQKGTVITHSVENEPYQIDRNQLKRWTKIQGQECYPGAKVNFTVNGRTTDYWNYIHQREGR